jgi:hypothetical protein
MIDWSFISLFLSGMVAGAVHALGDPSTWLREP